MNFKLKIALDLDDCIFDFYGTYKRYFPNPKDWEDARITKNVWKLEYDKFFWENLPLIEKPNFEPHIYATKRINRKEYTINCLKKYGLPVKPIYQTLYQHGNKADIIKGRCDVLIDDSLENVLKALEKGLPALLITRPHNINYNFKYRINSLDYDEIVYKYNIMFNEI